MSTVKPGTQTSIEWQPRVSRRGFLAGLAAGSLILAGRASGLSVLSREAAATLAFEPDLFVSIAPDGVVSILAHRSEMGTGIRTSLPMVVADELGADWDRVVIHQAIGDARLGSQNTDGSRSVRRFFQRMLVAGATARTLLERAAAQTWGVDASECQGSAHQVTGPDGKRLAFGDLVGLAQNLPVPTEDELVFRAPETRRLIGHPIPQTDLEAMVTGRATFGLDARREDQVFAMIERSPVLGGHVKSLDDSAARAVAGVIDVIELPPFEGAPGFQALGGVAVIAKNTWSALSGRRALKIEWTESDHQGYDSSAFATELKAAVQKPGKVWRNEGDAVTALQAADQADVFQADYYAPLLAHASMEPPCALAIVHKDATGQRTSIEVWAPTQNPQAAQDQLAGSLGLDVDKIIVNVTLLGGGFGRKSKPDYIVEAALLSDKLNRPVHVTWTREDDIRHDYYHTVAAVHVEAAVGETGLPTAWLQRSAYPTISSTFVPGLDQASDGEMDMGATNLPYAVPNLRVESGPAKNHVRIGWMRSVAHVYHAFAACSFPDELAHRAGRDPFEYLMALYGPARQIAFEGIKYSNDGEPLERFPFDIGRLRHVAERAAKLAGWGRELPKGRALGIACHRSFLSYCATVVEVEVTKDGKLTIPEVFSVIDAGTIVNPDRVHAQMEGAAVFGATLAIHGEITAKNGVIQQSNFHNFQMARMTDAPRKITVEIVDSTELPGGVGEVGVPPFAPALCNAIFAATGKRIRDLPLKRHDLSW